MLLRHERETWTTSYGFTKARCRDCGFIFAQYSWIDGKGHAVSRAFSPSIERLRQLSKISPGNSRRRVKYKGQK